MAKKQKPFKINRKIQKQLNKLLSLLLALVISAILAKYTLFYQEYQPVKGTVTGRVVKVADGDTITILNPDMQEVKIRLYGIDAPETAQDFGPQAHKFLDSAVKSKVVTVDVIDIDQYGRSVGRVLLDGADINGLMISSGYAWLYTKYCKIEECSRWEQAQELARAEKSGLWRAKKQTPPWQWRKENK